MFITFYQNNSGGYFIKNEDVDEYVIIEGNSEKEIYNKAKDIFENYQGYCECCGRRWDYWGTEENENEPTIYGESVYLFKDGFEMDAKAIIHRMDGSREKIDISKE